MYTTRLFSLLWVGIFVQYVRYEWKETSLPTEIYMQFGNHFSEKSTVGVTATPWQGVKPTPVGLTPTCGAMPTYAGDYLANP